MVANHPQLSSDWLRQEPREHRLFLISGLIALSVHLLLLTIDLPRREVATAVHAPVDIRRRPPMILNKLELVAPPRPTVEERSELRARRKPIPMAASAAIEPAPEPVGEIHLTAAPMGDGPLIPYEYLQPPRNASGSSPRLITPEVTAPQLIAGSRIDPDYPPGARFGRAQGRVVLQAVIGKSGIVSAVEVLSCSRPGYGLEQSAIDAVQQWRYLPATQDGEPVSVYFTIIVQFRLR